MSLNEKYGLGIIIEKVVNNITIQVYYIDMAENSDFDRFEFTEDTEMQIQSGSFNHEEAEWLQRQGLLSISSYETSSGEILEASLDIDVLAQIAYEFDLLNEVASSVETDILDVFRQSGDDKLTTAELSQRSGRPKSSVSRALSRLVENGKLEKVQSGVYRRH